MRAASKREKIMASRVLLFASLSATAAAGGTDMSATFAKLTDCNSCVAQGYGWCTIRRMCGGFAAKTCGIGPQYFAEKKLKASSSSSPEPAAAKAHRSASPSPLKGPTTDMSSTFAKFRDCSSCVGAGYGWCTIRRMCGGFAAKTCGIGPQYLAEGPAPKASGRNGLWESKADKAKKAKAEAPPASEVPSVASPPPASLLYAGPASPPTRAQVSPSGEAVESEPSTVTASMAAAHLSNSTADTNESELWRLPREALVDRILSLQATVDSMRAVLA